MIPGDEKKNPLGDIQYYEKNQLQISNHPVGDCFPTRQQHHMLGFIPSMLQHNS